MLSAWKLQDPQMNFPWVNILWFCFLLARPILTQYNKVFMRQFVFENLSYLMNPRYVEFQVFFNFLSTINLWNKGMFKKAMVQVNIPKQWGVTSLPGQYCWYFESDLGRQSVYTSYSYECEKGVKLNWPVLSLYCIKRGINKILSG